VAGCGVNLAAFPGGAIHLIEHPSSHIDGVDGTVWLPFWGLVELLWIAEQNNAPCCLRGGQDVCKRNLPRFIDE
jgi:hypothetical protein